MPEQDLSSSLDASSSIQSVSAMQRTLTTTRNRCWLILDPAIFLAMLGQALSSAVITQLFLVRYCQAMFPLNATKCDMLVYKIDTQEARELEAVLEPHVTILQMYKTVIEACIPVILSLFVGPWSDHHGRKPLILWPMFGYGLMYIIYTFLCVVHDLDPTYFLLASIPVAFSGSLVTLVTGMCAYITDTTVAEKRAFRMGMLDASLFAGFVVGTYLGAPLFSVAGRYGYSTVFGTSAVCYLVSFLYLTFIPESVEVSQVSERDFTGGFCSLFDMQLVVRMFATCFKKREHHRRAIVFLVIITLSTCIITLEGESAVSFLYTRNKFGWDITKHTEFASAATLVSIFGTVTGMYIFSVWLRIPDSIFAVCVFITKSAATFISGLSPHDWYMYIASK
ncbi:hypothetical protein Cfor_09425 [Coptotermes formosanus]|uniref:Major facilitator superfamily (MFS) profile domain-containing protein n=1 Tax=Coptotermes formosanus TaxID=36987 RepID=A0A6L2Q4D2_COPFO|nr:hypothetical protein Cfor_09425 [Coptotermes formosanus]